MDYVLKIFAKESLENLIKIDAKKDSFCVVTISEIELKKQKNFLLFFDDLSQKVEGTLALFVINFEEARLNFVAIFEGKKYDIIFSSPKLKAIKIRSLQGEYICVIGDEIYNKKVIDFLRDSGQKFVIQIDTFFEGYMGEKSKKLKVVSTNKNCVKKIKKSSLI